MRTSGGRGNEGWMMAIPLIALVAVSSFRGVDGLLYGLESAIREVVIAVLGFVSDLV